MLDGGYMSDRKYISGVLKELIQQRNSHECQFGKNDEHEQCLHNFSVAIASLQRSLDHPSHDDISTDDQRSEERKDQLLLQTN